MAIIKLDNVVASASITIQLIKDYSMYSSEITSSNGTIFQNTDSETTLSLQVFKGSDDITNSITDIIWSRYYFYNEELKEDSSWGENKKNKYNVILYKDEMEEKSIIQASSYAMVNGNRELISTARITIIKISDVYISDVAPIDPSDNMMWMDTNITPHVLKIWNDKQKAWISTGAEAPIVKNLIQNSNFWANVRDYYDIENEKDIVEPNVKIKDGKNWLIIRSANSFGNNAGIAQKINYPISANSNYIFSFAAYTEDGDFNKNAVVRIDSLSDTDKVTIVRKDCEIKNSVTIISVPFRTLEDTKDLLVSINTKEETYGFFYITELSLYNSSVYYPWEPCSDDINKQMDSKLDNKRASVFNALTDYGNFKALYESNNQYYIRSQYIIPEVLSKSEFSSFINNEIQELGTKCANLEALCKTLSNTIASLEARIWALENSNN